jgi:hypothetical protein
MFQVTMCSSSGGQLYEFNFWYYYSVLVAGRYAGKELTAYRPARPRIKHDCHHDTKVKPEAATAVIEILMMGGKTPETC